MLVPWKKSYDKPRQSIKKQRHYSADKGPYKVMIFPARESHSILKGPYQRGSLFGNCHQSDSAVIHKMGRCLANLRDPKT